jgi:hypothetical protein
MPTYRIRSQTGEELKCRGCNWRVTNLYILAETPKEAVKLYLEGEAGLCGDCYGEMLREMTNGEIILINDEEEN